MSASSKDGFLAVCASLSILSTVAVTLRFYTRKRQRLSLQLDDACAAFALVLYLGAAACSYKHVAMKTLGYSSHTLSEPDLVRTAPLSVKYSLAWDVMTNSCSAFIKFSALFFYRRLFSTPGPSRYIDFAFYTTFGIVFSWLIVFDVVYFFQCGSHIAALWNGTAAKYCGPQDAIFLSFAISNFILDVWILALPLPNILNLHAPVSKKLSIIGVFLLAFVGLGASIVRLAIYAEIVSGGPSYIEGHDMGRVTTEAAYLTMLEVGTSLVAVNLPTLWFLLSSSSSKKALGTLRGMLSLTSMRSSRKDSVEKDDAVHVTREIEIGEGSSGSVSDMGKEEYYGSKPTTVHTVAEAA